MKIEKALHSSYCADPKNPPCIGVCIIKSDETVLACKRCGNERIKHDVKTLESRTEESKKRLYVALIEDLKNWICQSSD